MLGQILPIARNALVESIRQPVLVIVLLVAALLQTLNTWIVAYTMGRSNVPGEVTGDNKLLFDVSMATVFVLGIVLAAFVSSAAISREIENKTILTVVSKPVGRVSVILGKFLGIAGANLIASLVMVAMLMLAIRHGVQEDAADTLDGPVLIFGFGAVFGSLLLGAIGNYLYNWSFAQASTLLMLPLLWVAYLGVLLIDDEWAFQSIGTDFKPQILLACVCLCAALVVMTALATAVSTRLGQVMTLLVCALAFVLGLASNHFVGRHVFDGESVAQIASVESDTGLSVHNFRVEEVWALAADRMGIPEEQLAAQNFDPRAMVTKREVLAMGRVDDPQWDEVTLNAPGATMFIELLAPPTEQLEPGDPFYFGASPNGVGLITPGFEPLEEGTPILERNVRDEPALVITAVDGKAISVTQVGREALPLSRPPLERDYVFLETPTINPVALAAWSLVPNLQSFWLVDAVNLNSAIPLSHIALVLLYSVMQTITLLALAVVLFQGRDVG